MKTSTVVFILLLITSTSSWAQLAPENIKISSNQIGNNLSIFLQINNFKTCALKASEISVTPVVHAALSTIGKISFKGFYCISLDAQPGVAYATARFPVARDGNLNQTLTDLTSGAYDIYVDGQKVGAVSVNSQ